MKSKLFFLLPCFLIFATLFYCGYLFFEANRTIFYLVEGLTLLVIIMLIFAYKRLVKPYQILSDSIDMLKGQDFSSRLRPVRNSEANKLIEIFNLMMEQLKNERLSVRRKNHFLDLLINASPQGVIILDFDYRITSINPAAKQILGLNSLEEIEGKGLKEIDSRICRLLAYLEPQEDTIVKIGGINQYRCVLSSFIDRGFPHPFILIEELTQELLTIEKRSYENVIRMMAHEVNNSAGAVNSTLEIVLEVAQKNKELSDIFPAIEASADRNKHLAEFISKLADVVKIPKPYKGQTDLNELIKTVSNLVYSECKRRNIELEINLIPEGTRISIDGIQFEHVLLNIIKNAYEAIGDNGKIRITAAINPLKLLVENNGPKLSEEVMRNLFTPFYTTKSKGQGVGLMFVREVLVNHDCKFNFYSEGEWTRFEILLPKSI